MKIIPRAMLRAPGGGLADFQNRGNVAIEKATAERIAGN
jgi:hypothetical protein